MWFAKWFGGRETPVDDDEPARFAVVQTARPDQDTTSTTQSRTVTKRPRKAGKGKGFDPYDSGAFDRRNTWDRTNLR
jgi:hypothetical protein